MMEEQVKNMESDELSLKDMIIKWEEWVRYLLSQWKVIFLIGIFGGALGLIYSLVKKPVYKAEYTFALEEKSGGGIGAYAGLASQFGLNIGGGEGGAFSGDNIIELMKSRMMVERALLTPVIFNNKPDLLINRYIQFNELDKKWSKREKYKGLKYTIDQPRDEFTLLQDSILGELSGEIRRNFLQVSKLDKKLSIIAVKYTSKDELFAKLFTDVLVNRVTSFYIETKTKKLRANIVILDARLDSVKRELDKEMYGYAINQDQNQNLIRAQARVPSAKRQMNIQLLSTLYGELVKNTELAKLTLSREEPLIQAIDQPILPLKKERLGKAKGIIMGGVLFGFLTIVVLITRRLYRSIKG